VYSSLEFQDVVDEILKLLDDINGVIIYLIKYGIMKLIEQLQEILCTVESVKWDISDNDSNISNMIDEITYLFDRNNSTNLQDFTDLENYHTRIVKELEEKYWKISLKHLMMYCNEKGIEFKIHENWDLYRTESCADDRFITQLDITKELYEQEDKVLLDIINFLKG